jgi:hypothetical protein
MARWNSRPHRRGRVTGVSLPSILGFGGGGVQWESTPAEREVLLALVQRLAGRRVLTDPVMLEDDELVRGSVHDIREMITESLVHLDEDSPAARTLTDLRRTTNSYLSFVDHLRGREEEWAQVRRSLIHVRREFRTALEALSTEYGLEPARDLANRIAPSLRWGFPDEGIRVRVVPAPEGLTGPSGPLELEPDAARPEREPPTP